MTEIPLEEALELVHEWLNTWHDGELCYACFDGNHLETHLRLMPGVSIDLMNQCLLKFAEENQNPELFQGFRQPIGFIQNSHWGWVCYLKDTNGIETTSPAEAVILTAGLYLRQKKNS